MRRTGNVLATALSTMVLFLAGPAAASPAGGDVTGDGLADVVARGGDGRLWLFTNNGGPAPANPWQWAERRVVGSDWNFVNRMQFGDFSLDGHPDLVVREPTLDNGTLWIYAYDPALPSSPWTSRVWAGTGWNITVFTMTGDVTGDGRVDMVERESDGRLFLFPHNGSTTGPPFSVKLLIGAGWQSTTAMLLADATGDGRLDIVARDTDGFLWIFPPPEQAALAPHEAAPAGGWDFEPARGMRASASTPYHAGAGWEAYNSLLVADAGGDGRPDVLARDTAGTLWVFQHNGAASGTNPWPARYAAGDWWGAYTALLAA